MNLFKIEAIYMGEFDIHTGPLIKLISSKNKQIVNKLKLNFE